MEEKITVTKENQEGVSIFYHKNLTTAKKERLKIRRSGRTKVWKSRPLEFKIPCKFGMYEHLYIDERNCENWTIN